MFPHNEDLAGLEDYLRELYDIGADAILVADPGIIMTAKKIVPELEKHLSTQENILNNKAAIFWHNVVLKEW